MVYLRTVLQMNDITVLKETGKKGADLSNSRKQCFDWIL